MQFKTLAIAAAALSALCAGTASAHHSFAMFDRAKRITIEGTVKEFQWSNPHSWLEVVGADVQTKETKDWSFEIGSTNQLLNRGWVRASMKPGDKVTVLAYPRKDGTAQGGLITVTVNGVSLDKTPRTAPPRGS